MTERRLLTWLGLAAVMLVVMTGIGAWSLALFWHRWVVWIMLGEAAIYAGIAWAVLRHGHLLTGRRALLVILGAAGLMRLLLLPEPTVSTDIYRYIWDGRVQAAGINPYRYRPADDHVASLRDPAIYPFINRAATATTIYPPMAQMIFLAATRVAESLTAMKAAMVAFEIATVAALLALLRRRGLPQARVLLYAWHPLPLFEFAGSGHIDAAAIAFMMLACLFADRKNPALAGVMLGAGIAVKYFPAVILPALYRRWDWRLPVAALVALIMLYLPYLGVGRAVLGFLPGYTQEEGLDSGSGFFLLRALGEIVHLPGWASGAYLALGLAILGGVAWACLFRRIPEAVNLVSALILVTIFTLILSPHLDWYFAWIIPFLCFRASAALIYLTGAAPLLYGIVWAPGPLALQAVLYVPFILILLAEITAGRTRPARELFDHGRRLDHARAD